MRWGWIVAALAFVAAPVLAAGGNSPSAQAEAAILAQLVGATNALRMAAVPSFVRLTAVRPGTLPQDRRALVPVAEAAAVQHGLDAEFFKRLIRQESGYNANAVSSAGAQGIAQFMPGTAALVGLDDPFDPHKALPKSAAYLALLRQRFGNEGLAAAAYNAGEARVRAWLEGRGGLPAETRAYVIAITGREPLEFAPRSTSPGPILLAQARTTPSLARPQSLEWMLGAMSMAGARTQLAASLEPAHPSARRGAKPASLRRSESGERALCASMGCIVAATY